MAPAAAKWLITGRVQGVGFRWFVARQAHAAGLTGWVRNLPDGRVEIVACGESDALATLGARLHSGPPAATVERVEKLDIPHEGVAGNTFEIR